MKFIVKFFPEITIKSKPVRKQFVKALNDNIKRLIQPLTEDFVLQRDWDKSVIAINSNDEALRAQIIDVLSCTPGIAHFLDVIEFPLGDMHDIFEKTCGLWRERLVGKTFVVRCKRSGKHEFNSNDIERYVGGGLLQHTEAVGVRLKDPDLTINLEVRDQVLYVINQRHEGLGGFPIGSIDPVVSLISGGFDSTVSTFLTMKRGMRTHFCFFNLGGRDHEVGVKEVALYLWMKYGSTSRVRFVTVPFEGVVSEILQHVDDSQMGVVLKRMMLRAGTKVAEQLNVQALVTGDSVAQVSSQTLTNLTVVDAATDMLVLRPLITMDKGDIIKLSTKIGTEQFAASMPEYCGVISVKPTTRAKPERIIAQEQKLSEGLIDTAVANASFLNIDQLGLEDIALHDIEELSVPVQDAIIIDVRHPSEEERKPLVIKHADVLKIPFYALHGQFAELDKNKTYMLYCDKGVMSRLHASHLLDQGYRNVKVFRP